MAAVQWIEEADGVFRGGGVKGLGLAGALLGFAEHPTKPVKKWVNVAGASAGAIIACYLATGHDGAELVALMKQTNFSEFQDFPPGGEFLGGGLNLIRKHGLAHGEKFREWFSGELEHKTFKDVEVKKAKPDDPTDWYLKLIAVDVTNRALLVLPDDLPRYRLPGASAAIDPAAFEIADAARMSMSIPYFFEPITLFRDRVFVESVGDTDGVAPGLNDRLDVEKANGAVSGTAATFRELTEKEAKEQESVIVDGGTLSNFPVWLFDARTGPVTRPTFGFTLTGGKGVGSGLNDLIAHAPWALQFGFDIFHTAQEAWDARFVSQSTRTRTVTVDAGSVGTTQFDLTPELQEMLIKNGRDASTRFLDRFDLSKYENTYHRTIAS